MRQRKLKEISPDTVLLDGTIEVGTEQQGMCGVTLYICDGGRMSLCEVRMCVKRAAALGKKLIAAEHMKKAGPSLPNRMYLGAGIPISFRFREDRQYVP